MATTDFWQQGVVSALAIGWLAFAVPTPPALSAESTVEMPAEPSVATEGSLATDASPATEASIEAYLLDNGWPAESEAVAPEPEPPLELAARPLGVGVVVGEPLPEWVRPSPIVRPSPLLLDQFALQDVIDVVVIDRRVLAFDARGSGQIGVSLELGEQVLSTAARGRIGVAITDRRMLGITVDAFSWRELRFLIREQPLFDVALGLRVAVLATNRRAIAFDGGSGAWLERDFGPREEIVDIQVGSSTGLVVTNRRALAVSPDSGGFFEKDLELRERLERVTAGVGVATITTSRRVLVFRGLSGVWTTQRRLLN